MVDFLFTFFVFMFIIILGLKSPVFMLSQILLTILRAVYKTHQDFLSLSLTLFFNAPEDLYIKKTLLCFESLKELGYKTA